MSTKLDKIKRKAKKLKILGTIQPSTNEKKKYMITRPDGSVIHFGDASMEDFLDHGDSVRRKSYLARAKGIKDGNGKATWLDPSSANYYSVRLLW